VGQGLYLFLRKTAVKALLQLVLPGKGKIHVKNLQIFNFHKMKNVTNDALTNHIII
jgi:hypothetical protein